MQRTHHPGGASGPKGTACGSLMWAGILIAAGIVAAAWIQSQTARFQFSEANGPLLILDSKTGEVRRYDRLDLELLEASGPWAAQQVVRRPPP